MHPSTESFLRLERIFHEALEVPEETREAFVVERCGADTHLRSEVEALLAADEEKERWNAEICDGNGSMGSDWLDDCSARQP
jgi:hypothetical protein